MKIRAYEATPEVLRREWEGPLGLNPRRNLPVPPTPKKTVLGRLISIVRNK